MNVNNNEKVKGKCERKSLLQHTAGSQYCVIKTTVTVLR